jgi:hypothetical protein
LTKPKPRPGGDDGGNGGPSGRPHGAGGVPQSVAAAQQAVAVQAEQGRPRGGQSPLPTAPRSPSIRPPAPTAPPRAADIRHSPASEQHILDGDGGRQGGHRAGSGFSQKTEFPQYWDDAKILDAAYQVTQQGPPQEGPFATKDAEGNPTWAYNYEGQVDGVRVRTTVLANGEIRTAFPPYHIDPGVIINPPAPNPAPAGVPIGTPPRYSHPDLGGDGRWTWEGPKGDKIIRVVQDAQGSVTKTVIGYYKK